MSTFIIRNSTLVNEGRTCPANVLVRNGNMERGAFEGIGDAQGAEDIDATGLHLLPGAIDDQVHFREPGLTHKEDITHATAAAAAGGVASYMEMPNTVPNTLDQELLEDKYRMGQASSLVNYSFYMGVANDNLDEVLRTDPRTVRGLKAFLGSSTDNMLVDGPDTLENLFRRAHLLLAVHAEDEHTVRANTQAAIECWGEEIPIDQHPIIRSAEACHRSSSNAVALAREYGTRLHVLHISTARELELFEPGPVDRSVRGMRMLFER